MEITEKQKAIALEFEQAQPVSAAWLRSCEAGYTAQQLKLAVDREVKAQTAGLSKQAELSLRVAAKLQALKSILESGDAVFSRDTKRQIVIDSLLDLVALHDKDLARYAVGGFLLSQPASTDDDYDY
jgi:hypothetical protein